MTNSTASTLYAIATAQMSIVVAIGLSLHSARYKNRGIMLGLSFAAAAIGVGIEYANGSELLIAPIIGFTIAYGALTQINSQRDEIPQTFLTQQHMKSQRNTSLKSAPTT